MKNNILIGLLPVILTARRKKNMKNNILIGLLPVILTVVQSASWAADATIPQLRETPEQREQRMQWFRDAKFGMFVHWGPASISGEEISWGMADRIEGGHSHMKVPRKTYMNLYKKFNPVKFDADQWLRLAGDAGMKYIVFITKHHDGFSMWPTKQVRFPEGDEFAPHYSIADTPYKKDICRMIQQAAKKHGLKLGWYYSTRDWTHPDYLQGDNKIYNECALVRPLFRQLGPVYHSTFVFHDVPNQSRADRQQPGCTRPEGSPTGISSPVRRGF